MAGQEALSDNTIAQLFGETEIRPEIEQICYALK